MNTYTYEFATGNKEIKISEEWMNVLEELDREEYNINKKETRRHLMLDLSKDATAWMIDDDDPEAKIIETIDFAKDMDRMLSILTENQRELVNALFVEGISQDECAARNGVTQAAVARQLSRIRKKIKNLF